jgi:Bacterial Ig-like domain (group 2)
MSEEIIILDSERNSETLLRKILFYVKEIAHDLRRKRIQSATLTFGGTDMPATIQVGNTATATYLEWSGPNGTGSQVPPVGAVTYASDTPGVATVDPNTGICTGVSAGTANISGVDAGTGLTASDVLTVQAAPPPTPQSATLTLVANSSAKAQASRR